MVADRWVRRLNRRASTALLATLAVAVCCWTSDAQADESAFRRLPSTGLPTESIPARRDENLRVASAESVLDFTPAASPTAVDALTIHADSTHAGAVDAAASESVALVVPPTGKLDSFIEKIDVNGHVRVRQETDFNDFVNPTRNRQRLRARLGANYQATEEWLAGLRMTTGDRKLALEPGDRSGAPLSYQDAGDVFDKFEFNLDRIFIRYDPAWLPNAWAVAGKFEMPLEFNPLTRGPIGAMGWDEAAHPEGAAVGFDWKNVGIFERVKIVAGESAVLEVKDADEASLFFAQAWAEIALGPYWDLGAGVAFFGWYNLNPDGNTQISTENNSGNAVAANLFRSKFRIYNPLVSLTYDDGDPTSGWIPLRWTGEIYHNTAAYSSDVANGYVVGMAAGPAVLTQQKGDWQAFYLWTEIEQDSVFTPVAQDDFQVATNFRGHIFGGTYLVADQTDVTIWMLLDQPMALAPGAGFEWRFRADLTLRF